MLNTVRSRHGLHPELIDELELLALFQPEQHPGRTQVHHTADGKGRRRRPTPARQGLIDQPDGGYLTSLGLDAAEQAQGLLTILKRLTEAAIATCSPTGRDGCPRFAVRRSAAALRAIQWHDRSQARRLALPVPGRP